MANRYAVAGRTVATAATANHVAAQLWNPHGSKSIYVREIWVFSTTAGVSNIQIIRSSARGATPTATATPDADNAFDRRAVPPSAAVLELATFGTQPTLAGPQMGQVNLAAQIGAGIIIPFPQPIEVPFGTGLCVSTPVAVILPASDVTAVWDE